MAGENDRVFDLMAQEDTMYRDENNWGVDEENTWKQWLVGAWQDPTMERAEEEESFNLIKGWLDEKYFSGDKEIQELRSPTEEESTPPPGYEPGKGFDWKEGYKENREEIDSYLRDYFFEKYVMPIKFKQA